MWSKDTHTDITTHRLNRPRGRLSEIVSTLSSKDGSIVCQNNLSKYLYNNVQEGGAQLIVFISTRDANTFRVAIRIDIFTFCHGVASASCDWTRGSFKLSNRPIAAPKKDANPGSRVAFVFERGIKYIYKVDYHPILERGSTVLLLLLLLLLLRHAQGTPPEF